MITKEQAILLATRHTEFYRSCLTTNSALRVSAAKLLQEIQNETNIILVDNEILSEVIEL